MNNNKIPKIIAIIIVSVIILSSFISEMPDEFKQYIGQITSTDYARITDVEYKAVLIDEKDETLSTNKNNYYGYDYYDNYYNNNEKSQSKVVVTEKITFDVRAASKNNLFWELWLGLGEEEIDGIRRTYKVNSVKEILPDGTKVEWKESPQLYWDDDDYVDSYRGLGPNKWYHSEGPYNEYQRQYECLMFYVDGIYREKITFEIEYEIYNAVLKYEDCSELYIPMYSGDTVKYLNSFKGEILIADKDMPQEWNYEATGFGTKNGSFELEKSETKHTGYTTFSFDLDKKDLKFLKGYEYLEFDMYSKEEDKHIFADYATNNHYSSYPALDEVIENRNYYLKAPNRYKTFVIMANTIVFFIGLIILLFGILKLVNMKRKYPALKKDRKDDYTFREIPRDIDPKFASELVFIKDDKPPKNNEDAMYASLLLSLARKQYIKLVDCGNDTMIQILRSDVSQQTQMSNNMSQHNTFYQNQQYSTYNSPYIQQHFANVYVQQTPYNIGNQIKEIVDDREPLTYCEQQYYGLILRHAQGGSITIANLEKRIAIDSKFADEFRNKIKNTNINNAGTQPYTTYHFYEDDKNKLKKFGKNHIVFGSIILTLGNLIFMLSSIGKPLLACSVIGISSIVLGINAILHSKNCISLTRFGEQEYQKWRGLYNFLKSDTLLTEKTYVELPLWEKYLVYATAFGISEKVIEAIKIRCVVVPPQTSIASTNHYRIRHIHSRSASIRRSIHSSSHSYRVSSYGGGYNAGGRGIGGGGGGH